MNKSLKSLLALVVISMVGAGFAFAADKAPAKTETKVAGCCAKANTNGETCKHACCVEEAKAGNNCKKCGGAGAIATAEPEEKKKAKKKKDQ